MKKQIGVWIDTKQAVIVCLQDNEEEVKKINSGIGGKLRVPGEGKWFTRMGNQFFDFSFKKERRQLKDTLDYFKAVQSEISEAGELVLFGPAAKKNEFKKFLLENGTPVTVIRGTETADSMTENQIKAWVKKYFNN